MVDVSKCCFICGQQTDGILHDLKDRDKWIAFEKSKNGKAPSYADDYHEFVPYVRKSEYDKLHAELFPELSEAFKAEYKELCEKLSRNKEKKDA